MKTSLFISVCVMVLLAACDKKEPQPAVSAKGTTVELPNECGQEVITKKPVKVGETGMMLPIGTRLCITKDKLEGRVELPKGYSFITSDEEEKMAPVYATYTCNCSESKNSCQVFFAEGLGFGCTQNSCSGSCTGKFTVRGNGIDRIVSTTNKLSFFSLPEVQKRIRKKCGTIEDPTGPAEKTLDPANEVYVKQQVFGVSFYLLMNKSAIPKSLADAELLSSKAICNCKGTQSCKLETITLPMLKGENSKIKIYFCDGSCNGCELTVD